MNRPLDTTRVLLLGLWACTGSPTDSDADTSVATEVPRYDLTVLTFNVEQGDAVVQTVAESITPVQGEALWGFSEVRDTAWADALAAAAGPDFDYVLGDSGRSLRLMLAWDDTLLSLEDSYELDHLQFGSGGRAPLVGRFVVRETGTEFFAVMNHLWRSDDGARHDQADGLADWVVQQSLPAVALGDFNFDWSVEGGEDDHDRGYDLMVAGQAWEWVRPDPMEATHCSGFDSVLDFVFRSERAQTWTASAEVLEVRPGYCPDNNRRSDHRPVRADFGLPLP